MRPANGPISLHVLSDASSKAYGGAAYVVNGAGKTQRRCNQAMARAKVAPLRAVSIPRLQLKAAVVAVRLAKAIAPSLSIDVTNVTFWTDSTAVLWWLRSAMSEPA